MSKRPYTDAAYDQIRQTIDEIDNAQISPVTDFFGDMLSRIAQYLKFYTVDTYQDDMQQWYTKILDSHNTTMAKIDELFANVGAVDSRYESLMNSTYASIVEFQSVVNSLRDTISGKCTLAEGQQAAQNHLNAGIQALRAPANTVLTYAEQRVLGEASKNLAKDALSYGFLFCKLLVEKDPIAFAITGKKLVDTTLAITCDLAAGVSIVSLALYGFKNNQEVTYEQYLDRRFDKLTNAKKLHGMRSASDLLDGLADEMDEKLAACPEDSPYYSLAKELNDVAHKVSDVSHTIDFAADAYDLYSGITGTMDTIKEIKEGKLLSETEFLKKYDNVEITQYEVRSVGNEVKYLVPVDGRETVLNAISSRTGLPLTGWSDPSKRPGNAFKAVGTLWSYIDALLPNADGSPNASSPVDVALGKVKEISTVKDTIDLVSDYANLDAVPKSQIKDAIKCAEFVQDTGAKPRMKQTMYLNRDPYTHSWTKVDLTSRNNTSVSGGSGSAGYGGSAGGDIRAALAEGR